MGTKIKVLETLEACGLTTLFILSYVKLELIQYIFVTTHSMEAEAVLWCSEWETMHRSHHCRCARDPPSANNIKSIHFYTSVE
jgi:fatty-acid desaturase